MTRSAPPTLYQVSTAEKMEGASMTDHSAVQVTLGVRDLERLLREAYENHQKSDDTRELDPKILIGNGRMPNTLSYQLARGRRFFG
jgi:hypothetical protein